MITLICLCVFANKISNVQPESESDESEETETDEETNEESTVEVSESE